METDFFSMETDFFQWRLIFRWSRKTCKVHVKMGLGALLDQLGCGGSNGTTFERHGTRLAPLFATKHSNTRGTSRSFRTFGWIATAGASLVPEPTFPACPELREDPD